MSSLDTIEGPREHTAPAVRVAAARTCRGRSPRGAIFEKDGDAVRQARQRWRQVRLGRLPGGAPDLERRGRLVRNDLRDRGVPIDDGDHAASSHPAQVLAQARLQIRAADLAHDLTTVITDHIAKRAEPLAGYSPSPAATASHPWRTRGPCWSRCGLDVVIGRTPPPLS